MNTMPTDMRPMRLRADETAAVIRAAAAEIGYIRCGFATTEPFERFAAETIQRAELYPTAADVYRKMAERANPCTQTPWARSVVVCIRHYGKYMLPGEAIGHIGRNYLSDRRLKACPDHDMPARMTRTLKQLGLRVRRGGLPDRDAAARAGVVAIGRNGFAYAQPWGSWINIESWRVDIDLPESGPLPSPCPPDCHACQSACPTGAIARPYCMRMDRCIAYLTYAAPEPIPPALEAHMGGWVYGCDVCQDVCPLNARAWENTQAAPWIDEVAHLLKPDVLATLDFETWSARIQPLFWYLPNTREGWRRWRRNAARASCYE